MGTMPNKNNALRGMALLTALSLVTCLQATAAESVRSPDGRIVFDLDTDAEGTPVYGVRFGDEVIVSGSRLGLRFASMPDLASGLEIVTSERRSAASTWEQPWGERRFVRDHYNELLVTFAAQEDPDSRLMLKVRVHDDGVGFRYQIPARAGYETADVVDEITEFRLQATAVAYWQPGSHRDKYEVLYRATPVSDIGNAHTPLTLRTNSGVHVSLHEAALIDYPAYTLERAGPGALRTVLRDRSDGIKARVKLPFATPWRTIQVAADAKGLINSDLILNLNEPNRLGGRVMGQTRQICRYLVGNTSGTEDLA